MIRDAHGRQAVAGAGLRRAARVVACLALLAMVVVIVAGAAHLADSHHTGGGCPVCVAHLASAAAALPAPAFTLHADEVGPATAPPERAVRVRFERSRVAVPRGPPTRA